MMTDGKENADLAPEPPTVHGAVPLWVQVHLGVATVGGSAGGSLSPPKLVRSEGPHRGEPP